MAASQNVEATPSSLLWALELWSFVWSVKIHP